MGSNPDISQKYKMGDISKGVLGQHTLARKKIYKKNSNLNVFILVFAGSSPCLWKAFRTYLKADLTFG
jgi:hypothetical protein